MINVVIVEDDFRIAKIHEEFIGKVSGFRVVGRALNGETAIQLIAEKRVDLVILDVYLPDILGANLIDTIRETNSHIDFIMVTAATETELVSEIIRNGVFDYIIKPVKMERFIETLQRYREMKENLERKKEVDQSFLDKYFGHQSATLDQKETPKGIDPLTLEKVSDIINTLKGGITAEEMGAKIGASRTTARRYLEYLISVGEVAAELEYGIVGRPERKYHVVNKGD
ncbi:response regulator [Ornithinibacillus sp. BX22]|uniref:Response regulator n=2 Tax=Ornithinibacillus TaxID=484508 RepID=A0A923L797_9BACI|nr:MULTISPECIES: response regulator [Ornithinibacillus]MBC5637719.1 response regulator [Ornithinibacillus hominis]MBS3681606.1 response regulator [Ornithinibacillus massiliensis]